jgi:Fe-S-cluster containining protein
MELLTSEEQYLFSKYWGRYDLAEYDEFWEDVFKYYSKELKDAPLPLEYNPLTVRMVSDMLDCPPSKCGLCCKHYKKVHLTASDILRLIDSKSATEEELNKILQKDKDNHWFMNCFPNGCHFLKDNVCSVYKYRPDVCYIFPFGSNECGLNGKITKQMTIRMKCRPALEVTKILIKKSLATGDKFLLPNLMIIKR